MVPKWIRSLLGSNFAEMGWWWRHLFGNFSRNGLVQEWGILLAFLVRH